MFTWKDVINLHDVSALDTGDDAIALQTQMVDVYNYLVSNNVNCEYTLDIEVL